MKLAMDSSALAKRYVTEGGGDRIDQLLQNASRLAICIIAVPEIVSGLNRRLREERLSENEYRQVKGALLSDVRDAVVLQITPAVVSRSVTLLEKNPRVTREVMAMSQRQVQGVLVEMRALTAEMARELAR